jgi:hypothetical protein
VATDITYNTVTIHNCTTREFEQELQYDASGTDLVAVRYKIGVEGYIHAQSPPSGSSLPNIHGIQAPTGNGVQKSANDPVPLGYALATAIQFDRVSQLLTQPRGTFVMTWSGNIVLQAAPYDGQTLTPNTDVDNGPKPRGLSVVNVTPAAIKVRWSIEFILSGCPGTRRLPLSANRRTR